MALKDTFKRNTEKFIAETEKTEQEAALRFVVTIVIPKAERVSTDSTACKYQFEVPNTLNFEKVVNILKNETYGFDVDTYIEDRVIIMKW
jgi:hypothetical protein